MILNNTTTIVSTVNQRNQPVRVAYKLKCLILNVVFKGLYCWMWSSQVLNVCCNALYRFIMFKVVDLCHCWRR